MTIYEELATKYLNEIRNENDEIDFVMPIYLFEDSDDFTVMHQMNYTGLMAKNYEQPLRYMGYFDFVIGYRGTYDMKHSELINEIVSVGLSKDECLKIWRGQFSSDTIKSEFDASKQNCVRKLILAFFEQEMNWGSSKFGTLCEWQKYSKFKISRNFLMVCILIHFGDDGDNKLATYSNGKGKYIPSDKFIKDNDDYIKELNNDTEAKSLWKNTKIKKEYQNYLINNSISSNPEYRK